MSSRLLLVLACVGCTGGEPTAIEKNAVVGMDVLLDPGPQEIEAADAEYHWELKHAPAASTATIASGAPETTLHPDLRGTYVVDRWLVDGVGRDLTHRYVIDVAGVAPMPEADGPSTVAVGDTVTLSGAASSSLEGRTLTYAWRLRMRPRNSVAVLDGADSVTASFVADVEGNFEIELAVFDGELWSDPADWLVVIAGAP